MLDQTKADIKMPARRQRRDSLNLDSVTARFRDMPPRAVRARRPSRRVSAVALSTAALMDANDATEEDPGRAVTEAAAAAEAERAMRAFVGRSPLFQSMPEATATTVLASLRPRHYIAGEIIMRQGEAGHSLFLITRGRVEVVVGGSMSVQQQQHVEAAAAAAAAVASSKGAKGRGRASGGASQGTLPGRSKAVAKTMAAARDAAEAEARAANSVGTTVMMEMRAGDFFGEVALMAPAGSEENQRTASIVVTSPMLSVMVLRRPQLQRMQIDHASFYSALLQHAALRHADHHMCSDHHAAMHNDHHMSAAISRSGQPREGGGAPLRGRMAARTMTRGRRMSTSAMGAIREGDDEAGERARATATRTLFWFLGRNELYFLASLA